MSTRVSCCVCGALFRDDDRPPHSPMHVEAPGGCIAVQLRRIADALEQFSDDERDAGLPGALRDALRDGSKKVP